MRVDKLNLLAIDTSSPVLGVACRRRDGVKAELTVQGGLWHTEKLMALVKQACELLKLPRTELDLVICGVGPGSFTSLRIGVAAVKGLAAGLRKPVVRMSSFDLVAEGIQMEAGKMAVILDARREKIYTAFYEYRHFVPRRVLKDSLFSVDELVKSADKNTVFCGNALVTYGDKLRERLGKRAQFLDERFWNPRPAAAFSILDRMGAKVKPVSLKDLKPAYLRLSEAEERKRMRS